MVVQFELVEPPSWEAEQASLACFPPAQTNQFGLPVEPGQSQAGISSSHPCQPSWGFSTQQLSQDHWALWQCTGEINGLIQADLMDLSSNTWINDFLSILPQHRAWLQPLLLLPQETDKSLQPLVLQLKGSMGLSSTVELWCICSKLFCYINVCI